MYILIQPACAYIKVSAKFNMHKQAKSSVVLVEKSYILKIFLNNKIKFKNATTIQFTVFKIQRFSLHYC